MEENEKHCSAATILGRKCSTVLQQKRVLGCSSFASLVFLDAWRTRWSSFEWNGAGNKAAMQAHMELNKGNGAAILAASSWRLAAGRQQAQLNIYICMVVQQLCSFGAGKMQVMGLQYIYINAGAWQGQLASGAARS